MGGASDSSELLPALAVLPGHLFWRARARVTNAMADSLPPGVDLHAYAALIALATGTARSQQSTAEVISVSRTTMAKVAQDLAEHQLVERVRNVDDRRSWALTRTAEGAAAARRWRRHADQVEETVTPGFSAEEREDLRGLLLDVATPWLAEDTPEALRKSIPFLITRVHVQMHAVFLAALEPVDIEPSHFATLVTLDALGPTPQLGLAHALGVSGPHVVQIVDALEDRRLVERRRSARDRRAHELHLTAAARTTLQRARDLATEHSSRLLGALTEPEKQRLLDLLRRVVTGG